MTEQITNMKNWQFILILIVTLFVFPSLKAQHIVKQHPGNLYRCEVINGDTIIIAQLRPVYVYPKRTFTSKRHEMEYWRNVRDVKKTLPFAKLIHGIMMETYEYIELLPTEEAKEKHLKKMQKELFDTYKPTLKKMTFRQGKLLIKLIDRETNSSAHQLIEAYLGSFAAGFWQGFGKLFGANLKTGWDPKGEDRELEEICTKVEYGYL